MRLFTLISAALFTLMTQHSAQAQVMPLQCTGFQTEVSCNETSGLWEVQLSNSAHPTFDPSEVDISTAATGITVGQSSTDPTLITLSGASAGDQFSLSINAIEQGAGGAPGLDLCCMGDIAISIPQGEQCIPQPPDRDLDVVKECGPIGYEDPFGSNMECTFTINYSGPPPTPDNPITISDTLTSGGPMTIQSSWPPSGADSLWNCPDTPVTGAYTCTMDNTLDTDQSTGYWTSYSSSFTIQATMDDPYRNCLDGQINSAAGAPVTSQSCTQEGDFELVVEKTLVEGSTCQPGGTCQFEIAVTNNGNDPYQGDIALTDEVYINGVAPAGTLTAITPPVCDVASLNTTGCTTPVTLNSGQTNSYIIDYMAPSNLAQDQIDGKNCVALTDETMTPLDKPETTPGKFSCVEFLIDHPTDPEPPLTPDLRFVKAFTNSQCEPGLACPFTITVFNDGDAAFNGPVAISDTDTAGGMTIQSVTPNVCLPFPTATPFECEANLSIAAGESEVFTFDATLPPNMDVAITSIDNCVTGAALPAGLQGAEQSCATVEICGLNCVPPPLVEGTLELEKELLNPAVCRVGGNCQYSVNVVNNSGHPVTGPLIVEEHLPTGATISNVSALPWFCGPIQSGVSTCAHPSLTMNPGDNVNFTLDVAIPDGFADPAIANCVNFQGSLGEQVCAIQPLSTGPSLEIDKGCEVTSSEPPDMVVRCTISITGTGLVEGDVLDLTDSMDGVLDTAYLMGTPWFDGDLNNYPCVHDPSVPNSDCDIPVDANMAAGQPLVIAGDILLDPFDYDVPIENCATVTLQSDPTRTDQSCATFSLPDPYPKPKSDVQDDEAVVLEDPPVSPKLSVLKTSPSACRVNRAAQTYTCAFDIDVSNTGDGPFKGPIVLVDEVTSGPKPIRVEQTAGDGWACLAGKTGGATCVNEMADLIPGANTTVSLKMVVPGLREGGQISNCGMQGLPTDRVQLVKLAQQAMLNAGENIGKADGSLGPKSRAGLLSLQGKLGLEQTGELDDTLFEALGFVSSAEAEQSCVTVPLPVMPRPKVVTCKQGQKKNSKGQCYTPKVDEPRKCPAGQRRNSRGNCYVVDVDRPTTSGPSCDARTTVSRGSECACRYKGMRRVNASRCACKTGLPPVRGVGCVSVTINRSTGSRPQPTDTIDNPRGEKKNCVTVLGVTKCF